MNSDSDDIVKPQRRNWVTSTILIVIWVLGLLLVTTVRPGIPTSMLIIGTVFFVVLIPAMNELVNTIVRRIDNEVAAGPRATDKNR